MAIALDKFCYRCDKVEGKAKLPKPKMSNR